MAAKAATVSFDYVLGLADDALILAHRLSEWCGHAPLLEEELALANIGLDLIGQARALYDYAGAIEDKGRDQDALAYRRDVSAFRNLLLVEQPNGDFAMTITRQFLYSAYVAPFWRQTAGSKDATLAGIADDARHQAAYHLRHAGDWLIRLGDGTEESHRRAQQALDALWPYTGEMFEGDAASLQEEWSETVDAVLAEATLTRPADGWLQSGGRHGRHSEHLGYILAELQFLQRAYPDAKW
ncbi:MAG TPA: 1,2-phenylacetyl-CoA epoxidase subunit PaaC [Stellaceae bacterium]|nr:1,2-phenylacetyl-CoA epoxidase subunit PaaC [Stellaceae bacterium]